MAKILLVEDDETKIDGEYAELVNKKIEEADKAYEESQKKNYA